MDRRVLGDEQWDRISGLIIGRPDQRGSTGRDNRMFVEGVLWIVRTGSPWRDLPEAFGDWNSVFRRFSRWRAKGVWLRGFEALADDPDFESPIIDSTIVRADQHASGAKGASGRADYEAEPKLGFAPPRSEACEGSKSGHRPVARRPEHESPFGRARAWLSRAFCAHRRTSRRRAASRGAHRGATSPPRHGRHGL